MNILAIDTSSYTLGIALLNEEKVIGEYITNVKQNHSVRVMPAIEMLLKDCGIKPAELSKIVVAKGPGSYTGVRIGVTIAKTLAWTLNIPLVGISSLEVQAAAAARYFHGNVSPIFDARRGQVYTGLYTNLEGEIKEVKEDKLLLASDWAAELAEIDQDVLFIGNDVKIHHSIFAEALGKRAFFANVTENNPRPAELALIGKNKEAEDVHIFVPNYIRMAEAEMNWLAANKGNSSS